MREIDGDGGLTYLKQDLRHSVKLSSILQRVGSL